MLRVRHGSSGDLPHSETQADREATVCPWPWWRKGERADDSHTLTVRLLPRSATVTSMPISVAKAGDVLMTVFRGQERKSNVIMGPEGARTITYDVNGASNGYHILSCFGRIF